MPAFNLVGPLAAVAYVMSFSARITAMEGQETDSAWRDASVFPPYITPEYPGTQPVKAVLSWAQSPSTVAAGYSRLAPVSPEVGGYPPVLELESQSPTTNNPAPLWSQPLPVAPTPNLLARSPQAGWDYPSSMPDAPANAATDLDSLFDFSLDDLPRDQQLPLPPSADIWTDYGFLLNDPWYPLPNPPPNIANDASVHPVDSSFPRSSNPSADTETQWGGAVGSWWPNPSPPSPPAPAPAPSPPHGSKRPRLPDPSDPPPSTSESKYQFNLPTTNSNPNSNSNSGPNFQRLPKRSRRTGMPLPESIAVCRSYSQTAFANGYPLLNWSTRPTLRLIGPIREFAKEVAFRKARDHGYGGYGTPSAPRLGGLEAKLSKSLRRYVDKWQQPSLVVVFDLAEGTTNTDTDNDNDIVVPHVFTGQQGYLCDKLQRKTYK
ncbi:hypothetical protein BJ085DRAFT_32335 [Dimargaris cristalligena]|uniref:Uncharacterized protein n=1 Tax=Dimargaris cristalligena TaxID=215637 RepID=A0A4P9ZV73_9FUNG|nr:hypothetical protein BJ085DRAFT_32335 [Dimargaris cristalligena]|eukprot:RKP36520.1 hypothetical protein BJ085DRAFT_32335 [Dimargaris cristalligena]